jgi:hypothetical protein
MKILVAVIVAAALLGGCATASRSVTAPGTAYTGEVWTWDEQTNVVTLRQGAQTIRVQTTPDQIRGLELHRVMTVRGTLAPPAPIPVVVAPAGPTRVVPRGEAEVADLAGTVDAVDPNGVLAVTTPRGRLLVWDAGPGVTRFRPGDAVVVHTRVQAVERVPVAPGTPESALAPEPSAAVPSAPGESAVVVGRVLGITTAGTLQVESPRGPVEVYVPTPERFRAAPAVEVRTTVSPAR